MQGQREGADHKVIHVFLPQTSTASTQKCRLTGARHPSGTGHGSHSLPFSGAHLMERAHHLIVLEKGLESLRWRQRTFGPRERFSSLVRELGTRDPRRCVWNDGDEGASLFGAVTRLQRKRYSAPDRHANQQFEGNVRYMAIDDLAQRRLRDAQLLRCSTWVIPVRAANRAICRATSRRSDSIVASSGDRIAA